LEYLYIHSLGIPAAIANLVNLEILTLFNNQIEELPTAISSLPKLRILNMGYELRITNYESLILHLDELIGH
jgi:Leucine-rich repeat (LRR) protein